MPFFKVTAYDAKGIRHTVERDAAGEDDLLRALALEGYVPISIETGHKETSSRARAKKLSLYNQQLFCTMLSAFLQSGLSLTEILGILSKQTRDKWLNSVCASLRDSVESGRALAQSMSTAGVFRESLVGMVEAGERSSSLPEVLDRAAALLSGDISVRRKIQNALTYPVLMMIVGSVVVFFLVTYVVPQMTDIVVKAGQTLPLATRTLLALSGAVKFLWIPALLTAVAVYYHFRRSGKRINMPFFRETRNLLTVSLVFSHLSTLIKAGIPLVQAIELSESMDPQKGRMRFLAEEVRKGYRFSQSLERQGSYSEDVIAIVRIGEAGGNLPGCLDRIAGNAWNFAQDSMQKWATLAEPLIIIVLGAIVGFVVLAVLLPIFSLADLAQL
ncbi:MAG: type II secretion system F family protein [Synergistaceae bacterium]|jgi:type II secretory pathway component PulF|nr:type II secretion system F family protein [Synergistaceae bacterium]